MNNMNNMKAAFASIVGMLLAWAALSVCAQAAPLSFKVPLTGAQEVPPVQTAATGTADLTYDPSTRVVTWTVTTSGTASPVTMAHFHGPAAEGKNAAPTVWISEKGNPVTGPMNGQATLTPEQAEQLSSGNLYINVHSKDHPGGELRGQVIVPKH